MCTMNVLSEDTLYTWATRISKHHRIQSKDNPLTPGHFSNMVRDSRLQPALAYLVRHVRPPEEVRQIRLNLKHARLRNGLAYDEGGEMCSADERFKLKAGILDARAEINTETKEIQLLSNKSDALKNKESELRIRSSKLFLGTEAHKQEIETFRQYMEKLKNMEYSYINHQHDNKTIFNSQMLTEMRNELLCLEEFRRSLISNHPPPAEKVHQEKFAVWNRVKDIVEEWGALKLLGGFMVHVKEAEKGVNILLQNIDLAKDAKHIRLKSEAAGTFIDELNPEGVIDSVRGLLNEMSGSYLRSYIEAHHAHQVALSLTHVLEPVNKNIEAAAKHACSDEALVEEVLNLIQVLIKISGERAALTGIQTLKSSFQEREYKAVRAREALKLKQQQIENFKKNVQDKQETISNVISSIFESQQCLMTKIKTLNSFIKDKTSQLAQPTSNLADFLEKEMEALNDIPMSSLLVVPVDGLKPQPKSSLSTTAIAWDSCETVKEAAEFAHQLSKGHYSWEGLYEKVVNIGLSITSLNKQLGRLTELRKHLQLSQDKSHLLSSLNMKALSQKVKESDIALQAKILPLLEKLEDSTKKQKKDLSMLYSMVEQWWDQPAKNIII